MSFSEWNEVPLNDLCEYISRGVTPAYTDQNGVVVLNQKCIRDKKVSYEQSRLTNPDKKKITENKFLRSYDILVNGGIQFAPVSTICCGVLFYSPTPAYYILGALELYAYPQLVNSTGVGTLGRVAQIKEVVDKTTVDSHITIVRANKSVNPRFLGYNLFLQQPNIEALAEGSTGQTELSRTRLSEAIKVLLPPDLEQKSIADTLSCLDDKIELNNSINNSLEEIAQAIFKSWFVDFEPFQDGEFEESELGRIPKGWRVGTIGELIFDTIGGDWGKETSQGNFTEAVICIRGADIPEIASGKKGKPPIRYILKKNLEKKRLSEGQIIIEISGGSPTQSTGRTALITHELAKIVGIPLICTNFCRAISLKKEYYSTFVYSMLQYLYNKDIFFLYENGTTGIKNLDTNNLFNKHQIVLPDNETMIKYKEIFDTLIKFIYKNGAQSDKLSTIRDSLLPKLISGEIRIPIEEVQ
ncbi:MAG: restriction endonuclease subunit S [Candidatus Humimicrobiaceae bacterium]